MRTSTHKPSSSTAAAAAAAEHQHSNTAPQHHTTAAPQQSRADYAIPLYTHTVPLLVHISQVHLGAAIEL